MSGSRYVVVRVRRAHLGVVGSIQMDEFHPTDEKIIFTKILILIGLKEALNRFSRSPQCTHSLSAHTFNTITNYAT